MGTPRSSWWGIFALALVISCGKPEARAPTVEPVPQKVEKSPRPHVLGKMDFEPAQETAIAEMLERLYRAFEDYDRTRIVLLDEAIRQIKAGKLEREMLEPLARQAVDDFDKAYPALLEAMNELHAILTPSQRKEFLELLEGPNKKDMTEEERQAEREESLGRLLDLTAAQKGRIYPALAVIGLKNWGLLSHLRSGIREGKEAFLEDSFDATRLSLAEDPRLWDIAVAFYEALELAVEELEPAQRKTLARLLDERYR